MFRSRNPGKRAPGRGAKALLASCLIAAGALSACSSVATIPAKQAVGNAVANVEKQSAVSFSLSLGITSAQAAELASLYGASTNTSRLATVLAGASLYLSFGTGGGESFTDRQASTDPRDSFDLTVHLGGASPLELRYVDRALYARADIPLLMSDIGERSRTASVVSALERANQYVPGLSTLAEGGWVEISPGALHSMLSMLQSAGGSALAGEAATLRALAARLVADLERVVDEDSTFTGEGVHGGRSEYQATVALRRAVAQIGDDIVNALSGLPGLGGRVSTADVSRAAARVPSQAHLQVFVEGGRLEEVDLDVGQFMAPGHRPPFPVPVRLLIGHPSPLTAPSGATQLDLSRIASYLSGLVSGALSR